jgi:hypothetical protein
MFSQRNNPYCDLLSKQIYNIIFMNKIRETVRN